MHTSVLYLLIRCAGNEEATFWAFCALVEDAHARDFYAKPPAAMNGFLIDSEILAKLARRALPKVTAVVRILICCLDRYRSACPHGLT